jgi:hypothetical protein
MTMDRQTLLQMLEADEFGLLKTAPKREPVTADDRLLASFEEITEFVHMTGREPERTLTDMTEAKLAMRLQAIRANAGQASALRWVDKFGLLGDAPPEPKPIVISDVPPDSMEDALASDPFGLLDDAQNIFDLKHVPASPTMPEKIAKRERAEDFELFEPLFKQCHSDLRAGRRKLLAFKNPSEIQRGKFFVLNGVLLYVANIGESEFARSNKGKNARTRCIFENGTESDLLLLSLGRNLYKDGARVTEPHEATLERMDLQADTKMGYVYVLRSLSDDPQLALFTGVHKIGFTTRTVSDRIAGAETHATFLGAPVEEVARYTLPAIGVQHVEALLHNFFGSARLDIWFERKGKVVSEANEWFDVPLEIIDEAIELINTETIGNYEYARDERAIRLKLRS